MSSDSKVSAIELSETKPSETKPSETKPSETKPSETKLSEIKLELKDFLELMRVKAPEMHSLQVQLARIVMPFLVLSLIYFVMIYDGIEPAALDALENANTTFAVKIFESSIILPRAWLLFASILLLFFYYMRFGYLYYQGTRDIVSIQNIIDSVAQRRPDKADSHHNDVREALIQFCKSNYIVQSVVVFLYPALHNGEQLRWKNLHDLRNIAIKAGPLAGMSAGRVIIIRLFMLAMIFLFVWFIGVSQFSILIGFLHFTGRFTATLVFGAFTIYYAFFLFFVWERSWLINYEPYIVLLNVFFTILIGWSITANAQLVVWNPTKNPDLTKCVITIADIGKLSFVAQPALAPWFRAEARSAVPDRPGDKPARLPPCNIP